MNKEAIVKILSRCKESFTFFCENFCKVKHPSAGIIPFRLFKYQKESVRKFKKHRYVIYRKCRQSGISTLTGAYALWFALFHPNKKVLIVSKRDQDAIEYLDRNIKFVYEHLPEFFHELFGDPSDAASRNFQPCKAYNEHSIEFWHGSAIKSLTSSKQTLRSNSASLVIIDEAAFIPDMDEMWTAGQPTLMHGGSVIVISTTNGRGNWYCNTWEDALEHKNDFHPIEIPWWEMDWELEWYDEIRKTKIKLAPCASIRKSNDAEKPRFGPYWSPWLDDQYRQLQQKGETWKFRQEILMEFIGAGNTVLNQDALLHLAETIDHDYKVINQPVKYVSVDGTRESLIDFGEHLWIWKPPVRKVDPVLNAFGKVIREGIDGHKYVLGGDISTGEHTDYSSIVIIDATELEQVAELLIKVETHVFSMMIDYLGRLYNNALAIVESTGLGYPVVQELRSVYHYPNLYYRKNSSGKREKKPGFPTSGASKAHIIKAITDNMGVPKEDGGVRFRSSRINKQANAFIHLGNGRVGNERGAGNNDDLMMASGLGLLGILEALQSVDGLIPVASRDIEHSMGSDIQLRNLQERGGYDLLTPIIVSSDSDPQLSVEQEILKFTIQLGGIPTVDRAIVEKKKSMMPTVNSKKKYY